MTEEGQGTPAGRPLLIAFAIGLLALALVALVREQHPGLVGILAVLAVMLVLATFFGPRMRGEVSAGLQGFRFHLVESVVQQAPAAGLSAEQLAAVVQRALSGSVSDLTASGPGGPPLVPPPPPPPAPAPDHVAVEGPPSTGEAPPAEEPPRPEPPPAHEEPSPPTRDHAPPPPAPGGQAPPPTAARPKSRRRGWHTLRLDHEVEVDVDDVARRLIREAREAQRSGAGGGGRQPPAGPP